MKIDSVKHNEDGSYDIYVKGKKYTVPDDMDNSYRQKLQVWLDGEGNTPAPYVGPTDLENWVEKMARSDTELLPRYAEDILDGMANKLSVPQITLDRLQAKKDLRATKP